MLATVADGRLTIATPSPRRLRELIHPALLQVYEPVLDTAYKRATVGGPLHMPSDCTSCPPERLKQYLCAPTVLLVENRNIDGTFLVHAAKQLTPRISRQLSTAQHVDVRHAGGNGEMPREVAALGRQYARYWIPGLPPRVLAVTDSDAKQPGAESRYARAVRIAAETAGVDVHVLQMRTIENYVPDEAVRAYGYRFRDSLPAAETITSLQPPARDFYPMKAGLPSDADVSEESEGLFPPGIGRKLGMGDRFMAGVNSTLLHLVDRTPLRERDHASDLASLVDKIEGNL